MVGRIYHVGLTVSDLDRSIAFYKDVLGLEFQGEIFMEGEETDKMFRKENCKTRVAYLNGSKAVEAPPIELIQFIDEDVNKVKSDLFTTSISEVCFYTDDIDSVYKVLIENHVECLSEPQYFDFSSQGFGKSKAFYFKDPDGIILEMMQPL
ncbi:VOC family protein [Neglectibacter sp. CSJ-5]|uniref:VOC family protein n=1 Tax=Neglectibacter sp. CSJ-5 TaxID=3078043 RepID=UPI00292F6A83|nr:VOC family protein [Neglectibacter sp. CSJ-5]